MSMYLIVPHYQPPENEPDRVVGNKVMKGEEITKLRIEANEEFQEIRRQSPMYMYAYFEAMHKQDGTTDGRRKCEFSL